MDGQWVNEGGDTGAGLAVDGWSRILEHIANALCTHSDGMFGSRLPLLETSIMLPLIADYYNQ